MPPEPSVRRSGRRCSPPLWKTSSCSTRWLANSLARPAGGPGGARGGARGARSRAAAVCVAAPAGLRRGGLRCGGLRGGAGDRDTAQTGGPDGDIEGHGSPGSASASAGSDPARGSAPSIADARVETEESRERNGGRATASPRSCGTGCRGSGSAGGCAGHCSRTAATPRAHRARAVHGERRGDEPCAGTIELRRAAGKFRRSGWGHREAAG